MSPAFVSFASTRWSGHPRSDARERLMTGPPARQGADVSAWFTSLDPWMFWKAPWGLGVRDRRPDGRHVQRPGWNIREAGRIFPMEEMRLQNCHLNFHGRCLFFLGNTLSSKLAKQPVWNSASQPTVARSCCDGLTIEPERRWSIF
jgi:hypothetical protein